MNRREAIKNGLISTAALSALGAGPARVFGKGHLSAGKQCKIHVFSKHLQWVGYDEMAKICSEIGFDGIDLTVRPKGHVEPENVERDLPKVAEACDKHGVEMGMMTTAIKSVSDPTTEPILKTAARLGVKVYRLGWYKYDFSKSIRDNLNEFRDELAKISELNAKYGIVGDYQNHAGISAGSAVWDIQELIENLDSKWVGVQYDIRHAMVEGLKSWPLGLRLLSSKIHSLDIKDFEYQKTEDGWDVKNVPLGKGAVDFRSYFELLKELRVDAPVSIHFEYPLGGADHGHRELTIPGEQVIEAMAKDLKYLRSVM
jgi:sugar phosphate isomerase/epimerase